MWKSIDIKKLDILLLEYNKSFKQKSFSEFLEEKEDEIDITDSIGIVTKGDFENNFSKEFIEEHFENLVSAWFRGLNAQVDFGVLEEVVKDEFAVEEKK